MGSSTPFILKAHEAVVLEATSAMYYGVGIENVGLISGGVVGGGFGQILGGGFGGITSSEQRKREKSFFDAQTYHAYLTNLRIVFTKAKTSFWDNRETKLGDIISQVPLEMVESVRPGKNCYSQLWISV